jgi:AcrR family transcriptional regulator
MDGFPAAGRYLGRMPKGVTKRRPRTRAALLQAARETFAERGFHAVSIEQVCEQAGYTRGAFYSNFASKDELFLALFDEHGARIVERLAALVDTVRTDGLPLERLVDLVAEIGPGERDWYLISTEFTLHAIRDPRAAAALGRHEARLRAEITRALDAWLTAAGLSLTVDPELLARLLIALHEGGLAQSCVEPDLLPPGQLEREFLRPLLTAITASTAPAA